MRLLILTQKVDKRDDVLGFFHRWIIEFAKHSNPLTVVALQKGVYELPEHVKVLSLGKERGVSRLRYIINFYYYIWKERKNYDAVFVHMNQEYVLLGGLLWRLFGKRIFLWRNHAQGSSLTRLAVFFSHIVFCTSPHSFTARFKKTHIMPVGVDTEFFKPNPLIQKKLNSILFLGRIAPVKNVEMFVEALYELKKQKVPFLATIAGGALPKDILYEKKVRDTIRAYGLEESVVFTGPVLEGQALELYQEHQVYVNLTPSGSMDKTIFEAMACGSSVVALNPVLKDVIQDKLIIKNNKTDIAIKIQVALRDMASYRDFVIQNHSLIQLSKRFFKL
ncbi:MAG: hypothetical protein RJA61_214 [Candidatus Parcubacteria bacterium]